MLIVEGVLLAPTLDLVQPIQAFTGPILGLLLIHQGVELVEGVPAVAHDGDVHHHVFTDGTRVHVNMDDLGVGRKGIQPAGHPVIEAGPHGNEHV